MLSFFRRLSSSKIGTFIVAIFFILILVGFAASDISNFGSGTMGFGMGSSTLAEVGDQTVSEREMSDSMERRLQQVRQQQPTADYATIIGDFGTVLDQLLNGKTLVAFADKFNFPLSKRLVDAEIAQIPQTRGLNGQFSEQAYQGFLAQQRLTDEQVREVLASGLLERLLLTPVVSNPRISVGMATPFASMLLESREGEVAAFPVEAFRAGLKPTDAQVQQFYTANRNRYMVPEQRTLRIAMITPDQVTGVTPSDADIAAYYNQHKDQYAAKDMRDISQVLVQDQATANQIAGRAKAGTTLAAAAAPAGPNAAVSSLTGESPDAYASVAGKDAAAAVFAAKSGAVVGPVKTDFGWLVAQVGSVKTQPGKSLAEVKGQIVTTLTEGKRKDAIENLVDKVQDAVDNGSNFTEAAAAAKLPVTTTPLVTAAGASRADPSYKLPADLAPALKTGFEIAPNDPPEVVTLPGGKGYAMVSPGETVPAAPAPLAKVHDQVASDWINQQAAARAKAAAAQVEAKVQQGMPIAQALKAAGVSAGEVRPIQAKRMQIATSQGPVPEPLKMLFSLAQGKSRMFPDPQGRGYFIVRVTKVTPGNGMVQPSLVAQVQSELQSGMSDEYAQELIAAMRQELGAKRNESAIEATKARMATSGS